MSSSALDFKIAEQKEAKASNLEIFQSRMTSKMKNKMKRKRSASSSPQQATASFSLQQSKRRSSHSGVIERRVNTLKGLIPNSNECIGVDGLFRETADYILALQLKVTVMQTMIDLLSNSRSD